MITVKEMLKICKYLESKGYGEETIECGHDQIWLPGEEQDLTPEMEDLGCFWGEESLSVFT